MPENAQASVFDQSYLKTRSPWAGHAHHRVLSRSGELEFLDVSKIAQSVASACSGLTGVDPHRVIAKTMAALYDGATTRELDELAMQAAATFIAEQPEYSQVAARLLAAFIDKEVSGSGVRSFSQSIRVGHEHGLINERVLAIVAAHEYRLDSTIDSSRTANIEYRGLRTLYEHYLLKHPKSKQVVETPQYLWMRMAVSLSATLDDALELYRHFSLLDYVPSSPILQNAGTRREQLSSCFLLDPPEQRLDAVIDSNEEIRNAERLSGDIGVAWHGARHAPTQADTNGIDGNRTDTQMPWLETLGSSIKEDTEVGSPDRAACVFLEPWHAGIQEFFTPRTSAHGAVATHHLNLAHWVCDLFMRRVENDESWSLFDPADVPELSELFGDEFDAAYAQAEARGVAKKVVRATYLYEQMMLNIAHTGNGWMTFKDKANRACNQTGMHGNMVHLSGPCTEILEVTRHGDTAICNLGTINLARHVIDSGFDFQKLAHTVQVAVRQLDRVIDLNTYPVLTARETNLRWRPVGLGAMGLQDVFFKLSLPFDGFEARQLSTQIAEAIYYYALKTSMESAREFGAHEGFADTRAAQGELQFDAWGVTPSSAFRWDQLREDIKTHGLRNSLLIAIAPTANLAAIAGCYECIEPQVANVLKRQTAVGQFSEFNRYLVTELQELGLWNEQIRRAIVLADGSVQGIFEIPEQVRTLFRTAWELSTLALIDLAADRGAFVDQSQSLKLFMADPNVRQLSRLYMYAWKSGLKTTYLVRSRWPRTEYQDSWPTLTDIHPVTQHSLQLEGN
jgi:ribonucleoside-diphosphate reductase alpha chain